ncbi:ferric anguibactin-binding protein [Photobacterium profundum]|uniref:Ferric anguibactin-binding protein n=1 Tax=Photobacterium profundum 3TCK TaxID=314280 RepID=Q1Z3I3_9GAMM|nr:ABC transporter substrate-binding protein [Photobacterium profundum]EAS43023.1 Ferric anguibactin-binding protein [Photobacterium profundum 3TCK]PSV62019.1 ferric anguibactin-binding protein [Photobacterium profundum]
MRFSSYLKTLTLFSIFTLSAIAQAESITIEHSLGKVTLENTPQRVVVVGGHGSLDTLNRLGIQPVGVVTNMLPGYLKEYGEGETTSIGSMKEVDFETIFTLKPDIIIAESRMVDSYSTLSSIAPTVMYMVDNGDYWNDTQKNWRMLGKIFDKEEQVETIITNTQSQLTHTREKIESQNLKTLAIMNSGNNISMFGHKSRFSVIFDEFGFQEARTSESQNPHGNLISFEFIAEAAPDVIFILDRESAIGQSSGKAQVLFDNVLMKSTPAYKNNRIVYLNPSAWYLTIAGMDATQIMIDDVNSANK